MKLDRIYTRGGDDGRTSLGDGARVAKFEIRVHAYGGLDEANAVIGVALLHIEDPEVRGVLNHIQNDLFDVGADLCVPGEAGDRLRITSLYTKKIEEIIDKENAPLEPLKSFILPGGTLPSAWLHVARNTCRRAERCVTELMSLPEEKDRVNLEVLRYLNRLSDLLFVLSRVLNGHGKLDVLWQPGKRQV
jgi:cob(I)alamin adenosyltransferase